VPPRPASRHTPNFAKRARTWVCRVRGLTTSAGLCRRCSIRFATSRSTSTSRSVSPAGRAVSASASSASA
jgi:hypothetical protein